MPEAQLRQVQPSRTHNRQVPRSGRAGRPHSIGVDAAIAQYLAEVRARRSVQAANRLQSLSNNFRSSCHKRTMQTIDRRDLISYMASLRERGLADRTIFNRISTVMSFPRSFGIEGLLSRKDLPRYTLRSVDAYSEAELSELLRASDERLRAIFGFFLATGCREQEVAYMTWTDTILNRRSFASRPNHSGIGGRKIARNALSQSLNGCRKTLLSANQ